MYKNNSRSSSKFKGCSPLQLLCSLTGMKPANGYYSYTNRYGLAKKTSHMRIVLFILTLFLTLTIKAENKLARIKDSDGYTNIRSGQGNEFPIVSTFDKDELFYCDPTNSEWLKVIALKWQNGKQIEGYIHKSRVQLIETLDLKSKQALLTQILSKQKNLADNFQRAFKSKDSLGYISTRRELETHAENRYSPVLDILPKYFCESKDTALLQLFFATMWADKGSADEMPSMAIGDCFICQADIVARQVGMIKNKEQRQSIYSDIEWGLVNHYDVDEAGKSKDKDFNRLKKRLDNERKRASP
jgi:hypothetical protein